MIDLGSFVGELRALNYSPHTLGTYAGVLGAWDRYLGERDASKAEVRAFLSDRAAQGVGASTRVHNLAALRAYYAWERRAGRATLDPTAGIAYPKKPKRLPPYLSAADCAALCDYYPLGSAPRALVEFLYATGCRLAEAVSLTWDRVILSERSAVVRGKGGIERWVPFGVPCAEALMAWRERTHFLRVPVRPLGARVFGVARSKAYQWVVAAGVALEIKVWPHALRHACATHLIEGGADIRVVQAILGHSSPNTTLIYAQVAPTRLTEDYHYVWTALRPPTRNSDVAG